MLPIDSTSNRTYESCDLTKVVAESIVFQAVVYTQNFYNKFSVLEYDMLRNSSVETAIINSI